MHRYIVRAYGRELYYRYNPVTKSTLITPDRTRATVFCLAKDAHSARLLCGAEYPDSYWIVEEVEVNADG